MNIEIGGMMATYFVSGLVTKVRFSVGDDIKKSFDMCIDHELITSDYKYKNFRKIIAEKLNVEERDLEILNVNKLFST